MRITTKKIRILISRLSPKRPSERSMYDDPAKN
jgi:hypothetical protein